MVTRNVLFIYYKVRLWYTNYIDLLARIQIVNLGFLLIVFLYILELSSYHGIYIVLANYISCIPWPRSPNMIDFLLYYVL